MYHICFSNPEAWEISIKTGVYGNVAFGNENQKVFWGKTIDLLALIPGDKIFFYIINKMCLIGLFEVVSQPYYCQNDLFENEEELYPFRFNFKKIRNFDNPIPVSELAKLIENGLLHSIPSFERDRNSTFRGIRQLVDDEGVILEETLIKFNPKGNWGNVNEIKQQKIKEMIEADLIIPAVLGGEEYIDPIGIKITLLPVKKIRNDFFEAKYENSLQGYLFYCLRRNLNNIAESLGVTNFSEALLEVPMLKAQQFRADIMCIYREKNKVPHYYSIIETKKSKEISISDLSQLIGYMKTFSASKAIAFNSIEGVYISSSFEAEVINYLKHRKKVEKENPIRLIKYSVNKFGEVSLEQIEI